MKNAFKKNTFENMSPISNKKRSFSWGIFTQMIFKNDLKRLFLFCIIKKALQKNGKLEGTGTVTISIADENDMEPQPQGLLTITYCVDTGLSSQ